ERLTSTNRTRHTSFSSDRYSDTVSYEFNAITAEVTYTGGDTEAPQLAGVLPGGAVGNVCYADRPAAPLATDIALLYTDNCSTPTASLTSTDVTGDSWEGHTTDLQSREDGVCRITAE